MEQVPPRLMISFECPGTVGGWLGAELKCRLRLCKGYRSLEGRQQGYLSRAFIGKRIKVYRTYLLNFSVAVLALVEMTGRAASEDHWAPIAATFPGYSRYGRSIKAVYVYVCENPEGHWFIWPEQTLMINSIGLGH